MFRRYFSPLGVMHTAPKVSDTSLCPYSTVISFSQFVTNPSCFSQREIVLAYLSDELSQSECIFALSFASAHSAKAAIKLNVLGYLLKPLNDDEMKEVLEKVKTHIIESNNTIKLSKNITSDEITRLIANKFSSEKTNDPTIGQKAIEYISLHFKENISQSDVANAIGVTPSYLSNIFAFSKCTAAI